MESEQTFPGLPDAQSPEGSPVPQPVKTDCPACAMAAYAGSYVYALGQIEARFPRLSIEKEFAQAGGRMETGGKTDQQVLFELLSKRQSRYLARQLCWVLVI